MMEKKQASANCSTQREDISTSQSSNWHTFTYNVPIKEALSSKNEFKIKGVAINSTLTRNGVEFLPEELKMSAKSLVGKPLLKDHTNTIDSIVGRVTHAYFDDKSKNIQFEADVLDSSVREKIDSGLIGSVSVGASVQDLEMSENEEHMIARGIDFVELSLVAVPADPNAGFTKAIQQAFQLKQETEIKTNKQKSEIKEKMTEETKVEVKEKVEKHVFEMPEALTQSLTQLSESMTSINERLNKLEEKKVEEKVKEPEVVEETARGVVKSDFEDEVKEAYGNVEFTQSVGNKVNMFMKSYNESGFKKLQGRKRSLASIGGVN